MHIGKLFKKIPNKYHSHKFKELCLHSKNCNEGDIFFSIRGVKQNGNQFIKDAIKIASSAPSGANKQPWHFTIVKDRFLKKKIRFQ